jgi:hypothetical protein
MLNKSFKSFQEQAMSNPVKFSVKASVLVLAAVVSCHAALGAWSANALQTQADQAVMPVYTAQRIEVTAKKPTIVKAERIEVRAVRTVAAVPAQTVDHTVALLSWNKVA